MSENPVRSVSVEVAKDMRQRIDAGPNWALDGGSLWVGDVADIIESKFAPVVAAAEEAMKEKCVKAANNIRFRAHAESDVEFHSGCAQTRDAIVIALRAIPTGTALAEYVERATKEKEIGIAAHIRGGALDGCQCEPCISVREIVERATAELRAELRTIIELAGVTLAEEEISCRMKHVETFKVLSKLRAALSAPAKEGESPKHRTIPPDGVPCGHPGCLNHISHPCEGCGRIGGRGREGGEK